MAETAMRRWAPVVVVLLLATGCNASDAEPDGSSQTADDAAAADDGAGADDTAADDSAATDDGGELPDDLCTLVLDLDLEGAFAGQLTFGGEQDAVSPIHCALPVDKAQGEGLIVGLIGTGVYDLEISEAGGDAEQVDLGREAVLLGNGDLYVLVDDETALSVSLNIAFHDDPTPPDQVLRDGVVEVARGVLGQL